MKTFFNTKHFCSFFIIPFILSCTGRTIPGNHVHDTIIIRDTIVVDEHRSVVDKSTEQRPDSQVVTKKYALKDFSSLHISGEVDVEIKYGSEESVIVTGIACDLDSQLMCKVTNGTLLIKRQIFKTSGLSGSINIQGNVSGNYIINGDDVVVCNNTAYSPHHRICVEINVKDINSIDASASSTVNCCSVTSKQDITIIGSSSSKVTITGVSTTANLNIEAHSSCKMSIGKSQCKNAKLSANSSAHVTVETLIASDIGVNTSSSACCHMEVDCQSLAVDASSASICDILGKAKNKKQCASSSAQVSLP